jgi:hypothetical protein
MYSEVPGQPPLKVASCALGIWELTAQATLLSPLASHIARSIIADYVILFSFYLLLGIVNEHQRVRSAQRDARYSSLLLVSESI